MIYLINKQLRRVVRESTLLPSLKDKLIIYLKPFTHLSFLVSFGLAWNLTNGWSYIVLGIGIWFNIGWLTTIASSYIAFLYLPFTVEKLITIPIAMWIQTKLFCKDIKTREELEKMYKQALEDWEKVKSKLNLKHKEKENNAM